MPLVIYGLGGGHTRIHIRMKVIPRDQVCSWYVPDLKLTVHMITDPLIYVRRVLK